MGGDTVEDGHAQRASVNYTMPWPDAATHSQNLPVRDTLASLRVSLGGMTAKRL
jgi:hypothetical protein